MDTLKRSRRFAASLLLASSPALALDAPSALTLGGFVDAYYAYDFNRPSQFDRSFTTQPARHNEFSVNLAYIEAKIERDRIHGRLALQAGTSVQSNYAGEPTVGSVSGPSLSRHIQEGYAGYRLSTDTWIDAGIMLSHIGVESFVSKDNLTYTRSLVADYSPYYETGVRLSTRLSDQWSAQFLVLNGWQNISESNADKALGTQLSYTPSSALTLTYNTFFGRESSFRHFHDLTLKFTPSDQWSFAAQADLGFQSEATGGSDPRWGGFSVMAKRTVSRAVSLAARVEYFTDPKQAVVAASNGYALQAWSGSLGVDVALDTHAWWRSEVRGYRAGNPVFTSADGFSSSDGLVVSSISIAF